MTNINLVVLTSDTDCDGTTYGAERVSLPARFALERNPEVIRAYLKGREEYIGSQWDCAFEVMTLADFLARYSDEFSDQDDLCQFLGYVTPRYRALGIQPFAYTSLRSRAQWNPWVYDDTIGIPALDTRYEESCL